MATDEQYIPPTTQRAYTLRLRPAVSAGDSPDERQRKTAEMQSALWATHEAVNLGAKVFGNWLLTLRGGLDHKLASVSDPIDAKNRRILLALSWLSVESVDGVENSQWVVAFGDDKLDNKESRTSKVIQAFTNVLLARGVPENEIGTPELPGTWLGDCTASLTAEIRSDAVWINRSAKFDHYHTLFPGLDSSYAGSQILDYFFGPSDAYFHIDAGENGDSEEADDNADFRLKARQWISRNLGTGKKSDGDKIVENLRRLATLDLTPFHASTKPALFTHFLETLGSPNSQNAVDAIRAAIGWNTGRPSKGRMALENLPEVLTQTALETLSRKLAEEANEKESSASTRDVPDWVVTLRSHLEQDIGVPFISDRNLTGEYSTMLDHAARRVSAAHSWIRIAEASRRKFNKDAALISEVPAGVREWLDDFASTRTGITGSLDGYRIRSRAVQGWEAVVRKWSHRDIQTAEDRIASAREVQADWEDDKFGDTQLFEALAVDDAEIVWCPNGHPDPSILKKYVDAREALHNQKRFKVPAYRHPDPRRHPVYCDFGESRWSLDFAVHAKAKTQKKGKIAPTKDIRGVGLSLWNGNGLVDLPLKWSSKQFVRDFAFEQSPAESPTPVSRATRLARSAAGAGPTVSILNIFEEKEWNGRLQAPRHQLDRIADLMEQRKFTEARKRQNNLQWFLTFSAKLQPVGPFLEYAQTNGIKPNRKGQYFPNAEQNKQRKDKAKLILSRLPGLRVLSIDLGHRFAAAGAVWQALSKTEFEDEVRTALRDGGVCEGDRDGLYFHVKHHLENRKARTTIYRRIGNDDVVDIATGEVSPHPAPWAKLDRQFLIKLQGEDVRVRKASFEEIDRIRDLELHLGHARKVHNTLPRRVDDLMSEAVRTAKLALRRHGDRARIAFALTGEYLSLPGDRRYYFDRRNSPDDSEEIRREKHIGFLQDALISWHSLFSGESWADDEARTLWKQHIATQPRYQELESRPGSPNGAERKKLRREDLERLRGPAESLLDNPELRTKLHVLWLARWGSDDRAWKDHIRYLRSWIMPSGNTNLRKIRGVGGLSLQRLATITELRRKVQVGYFTRLHPDGHKDSVGLDFGQRSLDALEHLREQRVKQIASRIAEAALGARPEDKQKSCHAIVIESLRGYRPDDLQTRRENRALMDWSSGKIRKYLEESSQLHGLYLREVQPNYTSRQCSRTGLPGIRCVEITIEEFRRSLFWQKTINRALAAVTSGKHTEEDRLFADLWVKYGEAASSDRQRLTLPRNGGDLFIAGPAYGKVRYRGAIQADLNAAANIGLRALLDPDFPGKWWFVPTNVKDGKPATEKVKGSALFANSDIQLLTVSEKAKEKKAILNAWRDPSVLPVEDAGEPWDGTAAYWAKVRARAIHGLRILNGI